MQQSQELDRLRLLELHLIQEAHKVEIQPLRDELESIEIEIERLEISTALSRLCHRESLDPAVIEQLLPSCRFDDDGLTILDKFGVPTTFQNAVLSLGEIDVD